MNLPLLKTAPITKGVRVLVRVDFDEKIEDGKPTADVRIRTALATIRHIRAHGGSVRILAHLGRPGGKSDAAFGMEPIAHYFEGLIEEHIRFISDPFNTDVFKEYRDSDGILFFENLRFWPGEEQNSEDFARAIAKWGDLYVNESFASTHRAHASVVALPRVLLSYAGFHLVHEVENLARVSQNPEHPLVAILGGAKILTKLPLIKHFLDVADHVLVGGVLANVLFAVMGKHIGRSKIDHDALATVSVSLAEHQKLMLPIDVVTTPSLEDSSYPHSTCTIDEVSEDDYIMDVGVRTLEQFRPLISDARTIVWNGSLGLAEISQFMHGTKMLVEEISKSNAFKVTGGGDTIAVLTKLNMLDVFDHISTGGGAMLAFLAGEKLPGIEALKVARHN